MKCKSLYALFLCLGLNLHFADTNLSACSYSSSLTSEHSYRYHYKMWLPLYEIRLKKPKEIPSDQLFNGEYPFTLEFTYLRSIEKSLIVRSSQKALAANLDTEALQVIQPAVDALNRAYISVKKKDESAFIYCPNHGTDFYLNGDLKETIEGKGFPDRYFRIWFGDKPLTKALKAQLLQI